MARRTLTDLKARFLELLPNNTSGQISPADLRNVLDDTVDSGALGNVVDDANGISVNGGDKNEILAPRHKVSDNFAVGYTWMTHPSHTEQYVVRMPATPPTAGLFARFFSAEPDGDTPGISIIGVELFINMITDASTVGARQGDVLQRGEDGVWTPNALPDQSNYRPPAKWTEFFDAVSITHTLSNNWTSQEGADTDGFTRIFLALVAEDRTDANTPDNNYEDLTTSWTPPTIPQNRLFYAAADNTIYPGHRSFFIGRDFGGDEFPIGVSTTKRLIAFSMRKVVPFGFAAGEEAVLQMGASNQLYGSNNAPLIGFDAEHGLYVSAGSGEGGTEQTETHRAYLPTTPPGGHISTPIGQSIQGQVAVQIPPDATGRFALTLEIHEWDGDADRSTITQDLVINNVAANQVFAAITPQRLSHEARISYTASTRQIRITILEDRGPISHQVIAYHNVTTNWTLAEAVVKYRLTPGDGSGFDHQHDTHVLLYVRPTTENSNDTDPRMTAEVLAYDAMTHETRRVTAPLMRRRSQVLRGSAFRLLGSQFAFRSVQAYQIATSRSLTTAALPAYARDFEDGLGLYTQRTKPVIRIRGLETS